MSTVLEQSIDTSDRTVFHRNMGNSPLGFVYINRSGKIEYMNRTAKEIVGLDNDPYEFNMSVKELDTVIGCGIPDCFEHIMAGNSVDIADHHFLNLKKQLRSINIYSNSFLSHNNEVRGAFAIFADVTPAYREKTRLAKADYILSLIAQVSEAVSSTAELEDVLKIILVAVTARQGLGFNRAFLFLMNESANALTGTMAIGPASPEDAQQIWSRLENKHRTLLELLNENLGKENSSIPRLSAMIQGWPIPLETAGVLKKALDEGKGINITGRASIGADSYPILDRLQSDFLVVAPIISRGKRMGVILADNRITGQPISDYLVDLLQTFANHMALAIERSQLYDKIMERAAELEEKNRQLAESQEQIIRAEKMSVIGELTSSIAHELRNPLTVIGGFANLMLTAGDAGPNTEYLNIILTETKRAESAIHQVLDFSKASKTANRPIDFNLLVGQTFEMLLSKLKFSRRKPALTMSGQTTGVFGNPDQLMHALFQFMWLSVEETTGECKITISTEMDDGFARMKIGFSGDESKRDNLVKVLGQLFSSATGTQKLTMIVAGETVRCHGGNFGLEGTKEGFPTIYVELPRTERGTSGENTHC